MNEMLRKLEEKHIFSVELSADKRRLIFLEECDQYYHLPLTVAEVIELAFELLVISKQMGVDE